MLLFFVVYEFSGITYYHYHNTKLNNSPSTIKTMLHVPEDNNEQWLWGLGPSSDRTKKPPRFWYTSFLDTRLEDNLKN